jgi:hypothetical protein
MLKKQNLFSTVLMIFEGITCTPLLKLWRTSVQDFIGHRTNDAEDDLEESQRDGGQAVSICFFVIDHELLGLEDELNGTSAEKLKFLLKQLSFSVFLFCISSSCSLIVKGIIRAESMGKVQGKVQ